MNEKIPNTEHPNIVQKRWAGATLSSIAKEYGVGRTTIGRILRQRGCACPSVFHRLYTFDYGFFDKVDSEAKAYLLGLLYADGCHRPETASIVLELQRADEEILSSIAKAIQFTGPIKRYERKCGSKQFPSSCLRLTHRGFSNRCLELGLQPDKSFKIRFPEPSLVPEALLRHFVRGYFDGDGSISFNPDKCRYASLTVIGNAEFISALRQYVTTTVGVGSSSYPHANGRSMYLGVHGNVQVERVLDHLYTGATIALPRKQSKYELIKTKRREFSRRVGCASPYFGVSCTENGNWRSVVYESGRKCIYLGTFKTDKEAAEAYDAYCREHGHHLDRLNFPVAA